MRNIKQELEIIKSYFGNEVPICSDEKTDSDEPTIMDGDDSDSDSEYDRLHLDEFGQLPYDEGAKKAREQQRRSNSNASKPEQTASSSSQSSNASKPEQKRRTSKAFSNAPQAQALKRRGAATMSQGKRGCVTGSQKATSSSSQQEVAAQMDKDNDNVSNEGPHQSKELQSNVNASSTAAVNPVEHKDCSGVNLSATRSSSSSPMERDVDSDDQSPDEYLAGRRSDKSGKTHCYIILIA